MQHTGMLNTVTSVYANLCHLVSMNCSLLRASSTFILTAILFQQAVAQCGNDNTLTGTAITPLCPGTTTVNCVQGGQYALVNVVAGNTYTFSTCDASFDTQLTLYNNAGGASLGFNDDACGLQSSITWTATYTGQLRVLVDRYYCAIYAVCAPLQILCTPPPSGDCLYTLTLYESFGDGWGTSFVGVSINGGPVQPYSVPSGTNSVSYVLGVNIGDVVQLSYDASGGFQGENSYQLLLGVGGLFTSGSPPVAGIAYTGTVDCVPPPAAQEDCLGATTICNNFDFSNNTNNTGNINDINPSNSGCLDVQEYQGTWYVFSPSASGTLGMAIAPDGPDDYDWAIWGPYPAGANTATICGPAGTPIRCAASSGPATFNSTGSYATGMGHATYSPPQYASPATGYSLPATLDNCPLAPPQYCGWVPGLQVTAGQVYLLYISNWSETSTGFNLSWTLGNGATLNCITLPVELLWFHAQYHGPAVQLEWATASESDCDRFEVERSTDGATFELIGTVPGAGNSTTLVHYQYPDPAPHPGFNYYRLRQVDTDGHHAYSPVRVVHVGSSGGHVQVYPNPGGPAVQVRTTPDAVGSHFLLLDATGRVVFNKLLEQESTLLDLTMLPSGLYAYRVLSETGAAIAFGTWLRKY